LWTKNAHRIPAGWNITLTDLSPGMLDEARRNLASVEHRFQFRAADAQNVPFEDAQFDAVIANHMLYHVPDRLRAFAEIRRVLRQNGELFAATNGQYHMQELYMLIKQFVPNLQEDSLEITEAEPLLAYTLSMISLNLQFLQPNITAFRAYLEKEIETKGSIHISKSAGLFTATKS
jgi:ubiquinone/menaquinone biosynthesis C-methylase UbiE